MRKGFEVLTALELQQSLQRIAERARAINTRDFEGRPGRDLEQALLPTLSLLLSEAIDSLGSVRQR